MRHRTKEITVGIALALLIPLFAFYANDDFTLRDVTGYAVYADNVIISGVAYDAVVDNKVYHYIYAEDGWYESKDELSWEKRYDMGDSMWDGLYYLISYDAEIYFKGEKIDDMTRFAREWGRTN